MVQGSFGKHPVDPNSEREIPRQLARQAESSGLLPPATKEFPIAGQMHAMRSGGMKMAARQIYGQMEVKK
jgi:hypothetical protein